MILGKFDLFVCSGCMLFCTFLASFWHLFGISSASLWHLFGISLACFWHVFGISLAFLWHLFGISLASLFGISLWHLFGISLAYLFLSPLFCISFCHLTVVSDTWALKKIFDFLRSVSWIHSDLWNFPTCEFTEIFYLLLDPCWNKKISFIWHSKTDDEYFSFPFYARQTKQILHNWDLMFISRFQILFSSIVFYSLKCFFSFISNVEYHISKSNTCSMTLQSSRQKRIILFPVKQLMLMTWSDIVVNSSETMIPDKKVHQGHRPLSMYEYKESIFHNESIFDWSHGENTTEWVCVDCLSPLTWLTK